MASKTNNLNVDIFCALKVSEVSGVPSLLLGNPGVGKTVSVYKFGEIRNYELVLLRGNSSTPEEIMGYDVSPRDVTYDKPMAAIHLRPSWFEEILRNHEAGKKTLLFLDEITTANEFVQAALLHLIFERKVGNEKLPDDTLIVSAGNYAGNLSNTMALLPPVMNRFMIYNITADHNDLDVFLNKYEGAIADVDGKCNDYMKDLTAVLEKMDKQERKVDEKKRNQIGEYIERSIKDTTRMLITTTK
jgi:MoxR-like ATPase